MAFAFHPGKKDEVRKESGRVSKKNNLLSSSPQSEIWFWSIHLSHDRKEMFSFIANPENHQYSILQLCA